MTATNPPTEVLPASHVAELINGLVKALRAYHMYLPNNPIYQRATENLRTAFQPVWSTVDELVLSVVETDFVWEDQVVYHQLNKSESLAWGLFKDGMRSLTIRRGAEHEELPRLLETINRARYLPADAGDDLLTLLWEQEYQLIQYHFVEFYGDGTGPEQTGSYPAGGADQQAAQQRHAQAAEEASPRAKGVIDLEEFDSTLYFLDEKEINYVAGEVQQEYKRDTRAIALDVLFDLFELQPEPTIRSEILGALEQLFPNILNARDFRTAARVLRDCKALAQRAPGVTAEEQARLNGFVSKLSEPAIVSQLLQSMDESSSLTIEADVAEVLRELRVTALEPVLAWIPNLSSEALRTLSEEVADKLAGANTPEVLRILRSPESEALVAVIALCGRLSLHQSVPGLTDTINHPKPEVRVATVQSLATLGTPAALALIDKSIEDPDKGVRLAAVRVAGSRGYKGALRRVESIVLGKAIKELDLTEKMAFFEAYGSIAGAAAVKPMSGMLLARGLLRIMESPETRACAAIALGRVRTQEAREVLQRAADDKDLVVRNAVNRALRESA